LAERTALSMSPSRTGAEHDASAPHQQQLNPGNPDRVPDPKIRKVRNT